MALVLSSAAIDTAYAQQADWKPLEGDWSDTFQKWIPVPNGASGAPRQGWLATADGFFTREAHLAYDYTDSRRADSHNVLARFNYPLSRRVWAGIEVPFYRTNGRTDGVADGTLTTQVMIAETRNTSVNFGVGWRLPWGDRSVGGGTFAAQPQVNFFRDVGSGFALRGRVAYEFPDGRLPENFVLNFAVGQTFTPHNKAPLGDLSWYVSANWRKPPSGESFVSITPGMRTHLGRNLFFLAGVEVPVSNARDFYRERIIAQFVQGF